MTTLAELQKITGDLAKANLLMPQKEMTATEVLKMQGIIKSASKKLMEAEVARQQIQHWEPVLMSFYGYVPMCGDNPVLQFDMAMSRGWKLDMLNQCYRKP